MSFCRIFNGLKLEAYVKRPLLHTYIEVSDAILRFHLSEQVFGFFQLSPHNGCIGYLNYPPGIPLMVN